MGALRMTELSPWFVGGIESVQSLLLGAISHHGQPLSFKTIEKKDACQKHARLWQAYDERDPLQGVRGLGDLARRAFPLAFDDAPPIDARPALQHRFAGLLMLADWIASDVRHFPFRKSVAEDRLALAPELSRVCMDDVTVPEGRLSDQLRAEQNAYFSN